MSSYNEEIKEILRNLRNDIIREYDESEEIGVRVNLMPMSHNSMSEREKNEDGTIKAENNYWNRHENPLNIAIHEATPGKTAVMDYTKQRENVKNKGGYVEDLELPTKPPKHICGWQRYDPLVRFGAKIKDKDGNLFTRYKYGSTIGYHARIDYPGQFGRPEIVIIEPAVCSPDQIGNKPLAPYIYGIERCVGEEQNYHLAVANQAMLTAFVLREMGYDSKTAMTHVNTHNFWALNKKACPARMLYASNLVWQSEKRKLSNEEIDIIKEYVPFEVFMGLVKTFLERDIYPQELDQKFIYDMSDYEAYMKNPKAYNYRERKPLNKIRKNLTIGFKPEEQKYNIENFDKNSKITGAVDEDKATHFVMNTYITRKGEIKKKDEIER